MTDGSNSHSSTILINVNLSKVGREVKKQISFRTMVETPLFEFVRDLLGDMDVRNGKNVIECSGQSLEFHLG